MYQSILRVGLNELIDTRRIVLTINYSHFPVVRMPKLYHCLIEQLFCLGISEDNFVLKGFYGDRRCIFINRDKLFQVIDRSLPDDLGIEGFAKSEMVFDRKSFQKCIHTLGPSISMEFCANDYEACFRHCFCDAKNEKSIVQSVKDILNYSQTKSIAHRPVFDFTLLSLFEIHKKNPGECYGRIRAEIPIMTLGLATQNVANQFKKVLLELKALFHNITGSVAIATKASIDCSTYMTYFGNSPLMQFLERVDIPQREYTQTNYIDSVEWFNLISPEQAEQIVTRKKAKGVYSVVNLADGSQIIQSTKELVETDIDTIRQIKLYLYPTLFPGEGQFRLCDVLSDKMNYSKPRRFWELAPVLENEVIVENGLLIYRYNRDNI